MEGLKERVREDQELQRSLLGSPEEFKFGFRVQIHNFRMRKLRQLLGLTQKELGRLVGLSAFNIGAIEGLRSYPSPEKAEAIANILRVSVDQIFPEWLRFYLLDKSSREFVSTSAEIRDALDQSTWEARSEFLNRPGVVISNPEEYITLSERDSVLLEALQDLKPHYRQVLVLRFGFDGGGSRTLVQVGVELGLTAARVRQIEAQAFEYLRRHHAKKLRSWSS